MQIQGTIKEAVLQLDLSEVPYPPPPWHLAGISWLGFFKSDRPPALPTGMTHLFPRLVAVSIIRYLEGTLHYDELIIGSLVRGQGRFGLFVHNIWVDDITSLWGGRKIWGLNKELANFQWQGNRVRISDAQGEILTATVNNRRALAPALPMPMPSFGMLNGNWLFTVAKIRAQFGRAGITLEQFSPRFGLQLAKQPTFAIAGKPFSMTFNLPQPL